MCEGCANLLSDRLRSAVVAGEALQSPEHLTTTDLEDLHDDVKRAIVALKCPLCRSEVPRNDEDRFRCVENNVKIHEDWAWARCRLGCYYDKGIGCLPDPKKAFIHFEKAANMGDVSQTLLATHELANCYIQGKGVEKSQAKAIHWYKQSSNAGFALSEYSLGQIYNSQGKFTDAFRFFELGAKQGHPESQCCLAYCYERGEGVQPSLQKSMFWNKQASHNGNQVAMANYAVNLMHMHMKEMQNAGKVDLVGKSFIPEALYWARKSKAAGHEKAETLIRQIVTDVSRVCAYCKSILPLSEPLKCSQCKAAYYCGRDCQLQHWKRGHKWDCMDANGIKKSKG